MTKETHPRHEARKPATVLVETHAHYGDATAITEYLTERAAEGWELVAVDGQTYYFKAAN